MTTFQRIEKTCRRRSSDAMTVSAFRTLSCR